MVTVATGMPQRTTTPGSVKLANAVNAPENAPAAKRAASATRAAAGSAATSQEGLAGPLAVLVRAVLLVVTRQA
ncbi:hypothetical protein GCM10017772_19830 [Promicromonospora soli]|uniref:Uncharacterized protein n=1 Tax=Promicromonospora soli TaxID=2035533 RepID=A0A919FTX4_9MICO|nr:hypothetical protein GCM10017772_19830 [Promicromonospora soli]